MNCDDNESWILYKIGEEGLIDYSVDKERECVIDYIGMWVPICLCNTIISYLDPEIIVTFISFYSKTFVDNRGDKHYGNWKYYIVSVYSGLCLKLTNWNGKSRYMNDKESSHLLDTAFNYHIVDYGKCPQGKHNFHISNAFVIDSSDLHNIILEDYSDNKEFINHSGINSHYNYIPYYKNIIHIPFYRNIINTIDKYFDKGQFFMPVINYEVMNKYGDKRSIHISMNVKINKNGIRVFSVVHII